MKRLLLSLLLFNILHFLNAQTALIPCDKVIDGLVAYYPLDGNANDRSGNGKNGNYIGIGNGLAIDRNGNTNSAYSFDGINFNYLDLGSNSTMKNVGNKFSISVWVEIMGDGINWGRILIGGSVNKAYTLVKAGDSDDRICFRPLIDPGSLLTGEVYTSSSLTRNKWYHVCAVYDGEKTKIYLNGSLNNTTTIPSQFVNNNIEKPTYET